MSKSSDAIIPNVKNLNSVLYLSTIMFIMGIGLFIISISLDISWISIALIGLPATLIIIWLLMQYPIAPLFIMVFTPLEWLYVTVAGVNIRPHQIIALLALLALLLKRKLSIPKPKSLVAFACISYLLVNAISITYSYSQIESLQMWLLLTIQIGTFYAIIQSLDTPRRVQKFLPFFLFIGFSVTMVGLVQAMLVIARVLPPYLDAWMIPTGRPPGTFVEAAWLSAFSMFFLIIYLPFLSSPKFVRHRTLLVTAWLLMLAVNILCMTRAAWLGLIVGIPLQFTLMLWIHPQGVKYLLKLIFTWLVPILTVLTLLVILLIPDLPNRVINRFLDIGNTSEAAASLRLDDFNDVMRLVRKRPWTGYGIGTLNAVMQNPINNPRRRNFANVSMNVYSTMLFDAGIPSLVTGFLLTILIPIEILRNATRTPDPFDKELLIALSVGMFALVLTFLFSNGFPRGWYWALAGVSLAASRVLSTGRKDVK